MSADVRLLQAGAGHLTVLRNLLQFYLYDFSEMLAGTPDGRVDENGLFDPGFDMARYVDPALAGGRRFWAYLAQVEGHWAGFALISDRADRAPQGREGRNVDEFFVMRACRRQGVGQTLAHRVFDTFRGWWQITEIEENLPAQAFWRTVISAYTGGRYADFTTVEDSETIIWQTFDSAAWPP